MTVKDIESSIRRCFSVAHRALSGEFEKSTIALFIFSVTLHSLIIFQVLPPDRFVKYQVAAQNYLNGTLVPERLLDFSFLYFYTHVLFQKCFDNANTAILWAQILLTGISGPLFFILLRRSFSAPVCFVIALAFITNSSLIIYTDIFEPEPLIICFVLAFLVLAQRCDGRGALLGGLALSLCLLTRLNFLLLALVTPFFFWLHRKSGREWLRMVLLFEIPVLLGLSLLMVRNFGATGTLTFFTMNPGYVFYEGNNPTSIGESAVYPFLIYDSRKEFPFDSDYRHELYRIFARRTIQKDLTVRQVNAFWTQKARDYIFDHPARFFSLLATKTTYFFHDFKRHDLFHMYGKEERVGGLLPSFPFSVVSAMALVGMIFLAKQWRNTILIYAVFFNQFGVMLLTYVSERQRVAVLALFLFFAAQVLQKLFEKKDFVLPVFFVFLLTLFLHPKTDYMKDKLHTIQKSELCDEAYRKAFHYRQQGSLQLAASVNASCFASAPWLPDDTRLAGVGVTGESFRKQALEMALLAQSGTPSSLFDLAVLYIENGKLSEAGSILEDLIKGGYRFNRRFTQCSDPNFYMGRICELRNDLSKANYYFKKALQNNPGDPWVLSHLAVLSKDERWEERVYRYFDAIDAAFFLGKAHFEMGSYDEAVRYLSYVVDLLPEYRRGVIYLSAALGKTGRIKEAVDLYETAIKKRQDPIMLEEEVLDVFQSYADQAPGDVEARRHLEAVRISFGNRGQVARKLREAGIDYPLLLDLENVVPKSLRGWGVRDHGDMSRLGKDRTILRSVLKSSSCRVCSDSLGRMPTGRIKTGNEHIVPDVKADHHPKGEVVPS
jgi:tetratricopeptide (TPR) repeat protein